MVLWKQSRIEIIGMAGNHSLPRIHLVFIERALI